MAKNSEPSLTLEKIQEISAKNDPKAAQKKVLSRVKALKDNELFPLLKELVPYQKNLGIGIFMGLAEGRDEENQLLWYAINRIEDQGIRRNVFTNKEIYNYFNGEEAKSIEVEGFGEAQTQRSDASDSTREGKDIGDGNSGKNSGGSEGNASQENQRQGVQEPHHQ